MWAAVAAAVIAGGRLRCLLYLYAQHLPRITADDGDLPRILLMMVIGGQVAA